MTLRRAAIVAPIRTAVGKFGGSLSSITAGDLGAVILKALIERTKIDPARVDDVVFSQGYGNAEAPSIGHWSWLAAGLPLEVPGYQLDRRCGSGLQAIISAAHTLMLGDADFAIGGGAESMSRGPYLLPSARWGARMGDAQVQDYMLGILHDPFHGIHMGITAENIAQRNQISREVQDALALTDQQRAAHAIAQGYFESQIAAVEVHGRKTSVMFNIDEHPRATTLQQLAQMKPAFKKDGSVTAGNASGLNDGAGALVLASGAAVQADNLAPVARLVAYAHAGVEPELMGLGPIPATRLALKRAGLKIADMDVIEANIAFAAQACAVMQELDMDPARVNPNGSGIALGHPVGATGAIIATKAIHELHRIKGRYALATMCIGGGQGIAVIFERI